MQNKTAVTIVATILVVALIFEILHPAGYLYPFFTKQNTPSPQKRKRVPPIIPAWLTGWAYRKSHIINSVANAGIGYQVKVVVHYGNGTDDGQNVYCNYHCKPDFNDIRFTDDDGKTLLNYWMESKIDGSYALFWCQIIDDLSSQNCTIYIYYGNPDATTASNGQNTFLQFDAFDDLSAWTLDLYNESQSATIEDGQLKFTHNIAAFCHVERSMTFDSIAVQVKLKRDDTYQESLWGIGLGLYFSLYNYVAIKLSYLQGMPRWFRLFRDVNGELTTAYVGGHYWTNNSYTWVRIRLTATHVSFDYSSDGQTWTEIATYSREATWVTPTLVIIGHGHEHQVGQNENPDWDNSGTIGESVVTWADDYLVRKYVYPEPTHGAWGNEETY